LWFEANLGKQFERPYLEKTLHKKGLVKWLKVKVLSSSPSTAKKKFCMCSSSASEFLWLILTSSKGSSYALQSNEEAKNKQNTQKGKNIHRLKG
jgi:hypothetical protein